MRGVKSANGASADQTVHLLAADTCNPSTWEPETEGKSGVQVYPGLHETYFNTKLNNKILCRRNIHHFYPHCSGQMSQVPTPRGLGEETYHDGTLTQSPIGEHYLPSGHPVFSWFHFFSPQEKDFKTLTWSCVRNLWWCSSYLYHEFTVCCGHCNKIPQTGWLRKEKSVSQFWRPQVYDQGLLGLIPPVPSP